MRFLTQQRLRKQRDFTEVRNSGQKFYCGGFILQIRIAEDTQAQSVRRLGVIASRRVGNAVKRNKAKRMFREIFRLNQEALPIQCDTTIVVLKAFDSFTYSNLEKRYLGAIKKLKHG